MSTDPVDTVSQLVDPEVQRQGGGQAYTTRPSDGDLHNQSPSSQFSKNECLPRLFDESNGIKQARTRPR